MSNRLKPSRVFALFLIGSLLFTIQPDDNVVLAAETLINNVPNVLVVFSAANSEKIDEDLRKLDLLISHFTENIVFKPYSQIETTDMKQATHLFYFGQQEEILPPGFLDLVQRYTGVMVAIGYNAAQLGDRFLFMELCSPEEVLIDRISRYPFANQQLSFLPQPILEINVVEQSNVRPLLMGKAADNQYPLFIQHNQSYYFASTNIFGSLSIALAEGLNEVFGRENCGVNHCCIRLEDIHPLVDPKNLKAIAQILIEKDIPYMMAVIPIYTNPETGKQYHFSDTPELLKVLKYMQNNGGSVILHGYTHQFRLSETGEGFEFWDVEHNTPIYHGPEEKVLIKNREDFASKQEYDHHLDRQKAFERNYIETRLINGIQELATYGLFPLAFEAPHYAMSQHGYQVASDFFSTYVGHVQISDEDWRVTATAPWITKPSFLHGMTLLPETIHYADPDDPHTVESMLDLAQDYKFVGEGVISGFYHPYLGVELFQELIEGLEKIPRLLWFDLKQLNNRVSTPNVEIRSEDGRLFINIKRSGLLFASPGYLAYRVRETVKKISWSLAGLGLLGIVFFVSEIIISVSNNKAVDKGKDHA